MQKNILAFVRLGYDSALGMARLPLPLVQVGTATFEGYKDDNPFLIAVSCPTRWFRPVMNGVVFVNSFINALILLLSGDVETHPGPGMMKAQKAQLELVLATVKKLEAGQTEVLGELRNLREDQTRTELAVSALSERMVTVEARVSALRDIGDNVEATNTSLENMKQKNSKS